MKIVFLISFMMFIASCSGKQNQSIIKLNHEKKISEFTSCSGRGTISSIGNFSGQLSFDFLAQNDSSFFQFQDFLGRKVLILWLTSSSAEAWNLIENKKYSHSKISDLVPILSVIQPRYLIDFLWGEDISNSDFDFSGFDNATILLEKSNPDELIINKAIFSDGKNNQKLSIIIKSRIPSKDLIDLGKFWKII